MKAFAALVAELDSSTSTNDKVDALRRHFAGAAAADAAWALYFLSGGRPRRAVPTARLREVACREAGVPDWLFDECRQAVGDLAETIALLLPGGPAAADLGLAGWVEQRLLPLQGAAADDQARMLAQCWRELDAAGRFLSVKLIGGGFRVGAGRVLVQRALAEARGVDPKVLAHRLMGYTDAASRPGAERFEALFAAPDASAAELPYPFFLAHPLPAEGAAAVCGPGPLADWLVEWKVDGIRAQIVRRAGCTWIWSRGEEPLTDRFPELLDRAAALPDGTVLDGEIVAWRDGRPAPFQLLQRRIGRKTVGRRLLAEVPVAFLAFDLLEWQGVDRRDAPLRQRREWLEALAPAAGIDLSPRIDAADRDALAAQLAECRARGVEGFMLKSLAGPYGVGRTRPGGLGWWKWKVEPLAVDAVLVYAQAGHGRRAGVYTDYSFALWNRPPVGAAEAAAVAEAIARREPPDPDGLQLMTFAKAYSGLTDAEFAEVDRVIRATTIDRFGPVRSVRPTLVFELGFEGVNRSPRHKSGLAVRFPRMLRLRRDKPLHEADTVERLRAMLPPAPG